MARGTAPLSFKDQESLAGDSSFSVPGFGRIPTKGDSPFIRDLFRELLGKVIQYLLKKTFRIREPDRGKDLEDVIYLDSRQASKEGRGNTFIVRDQKS